MGCPVPKALSWQHHHRATVVTDGPETLKVWSPLITQACLPLALLTAQLDLVETVVKTGLMGEVEADHSGPQMLWPAAPNMAVP